MSIVQRLQARVQYWHLLGRYYVNKWHYDGSKLVDRVLYGQGTKGEGPQVASVAFMITRGMRQQLVDAGFPSSAISTLQPAVAQKIIADKVTFAQFEELQKKQQVERVAERAKQTLRQEEEQEQQQREKAGTSVALVKQKEEASKDEHMKKTPS